jgi:hypothetical protein
LEGTASLQTSLQQWTTYLLTIINNLSHKIRLFSLTNALPACYYPVTRETLNLFALGEATMPSGLRARSRSRWVALFAAILALASLITSVNAAIRRPVEIQILNVSDWHGQLDPNSVSVNGANVNIGGAAVLSAYFNADRAANPNTLTLTAGDRRCDPAALRLLRGYSGDQGDAADGL